MKKVSFLILSILTGLFNVISAQQSKDTTYWNTSGNASVNFSQISFSNWIAGGKNSVSGVGLFNININYKKDQTTWENALSTGYGLLKEGKNEGVKTEDKLKISSKLGLPSKISEFIQYSFLMNFNTQFANGYNYPDTENKISGWFAPAYLIVATGLDYKPSDNFSLFVSPASGKFTFVTDEELSDAGAFGVDPGKKARAELGATVKSELKTPIVKNVDLVTALKLFSNYLDNPQYVDVNWDITINMKINDYLSANLITNMIYDHDILIPLDDKGNTGRRIQLKQLFGVGLSYKF